MKRNKALVQAAFALIMVFVLGTVAATQTTITFYDPRAHTAIGRVTDQLVAEFMAANPDIIIEHVRLNGYDDIHRKTVSAWLSGQSPNVVIQEQSRWFNFAYDKMFLPLDDLIANDPNITVDDLYPNIVEHLTWDGQLWGIPFTISTPVIYYNKDLFSARGLQPVAPTTWDAILGVSRAIVHSPTGDSAGNVWGMDFTQWGWMFEAWIGQNGGQLASSDGRRYTMNSEEAIEAMEFTQSLVLEHKVARQGSGSSDFWAGRMGMTERSTAYLSAYIADAQKAGFDMGVAPLACNIECYAPIGGGNLHVMDTGTDAQKEAAWRFVSFLTETETLARIGVETGYMVGRQSSIRSATLQDHFRDESRALTTYEQLPNARPRAKVANWAGELASALASFGTRQHRDGINVRIELNALAQRANLLLDEWYAARESH